MFRYLQKWMTIANGSRSLHFQVGCRLPERDGAASARGIRRVHGGKLCREVVGSSVRAGGCRPRSGMDELCGEGKWRHCRHHEDIFCTRPVGPLLQPSVDAGRRDPRAVRHDSGCRVPPHRANRCQKSKRSGNREGRNSNASAL